MIQQYITNNKLAIIVKPNSRKSEIIGFDENKQMLKVAIAAPPENNKANKEVIKFFHKLTKKKVEIVIGLKRREKVLKFS